jgi:hypothetical protein
MVLFLGQFREYVKRAGAGDRMTAIGRQVTGVRLSKDRDWIALDLDNGDQLAADVESECCSETEIRHLSGVDVLLRYPITGFSDDPLPNPVERPERDWPQPSESQYGLTIRTTGGVFTLDYRNYSNGYYGGGLCPRGDAVRVGGRVIVSDE